jgi:hypothetical protein
MALSVGQRSRGSRVGLPVPKDAQDIIHLAGPMTSGHLLSALLERWLRPMRILKKIVQQIVQVPEIHDNGVP